MIAIPGCGRRFLLLAFLALLSGCGRSATVEGTLTLDGTPVEAGHITFVPIEGTAGSGARAAIANGRYAIGRATRIQPGVYRVEVSARSKTGKKIPVGSPAPRGTMADEEVEAAPAQYNKKSTLRQELKAGANTNVDFALSTKAN
jgi:hypothetical protein